MLVTLLPRLIISKAAAAFEHDGSALFGMVMLVRRLQPERRSWMLMTVSGDVVGALVAWGHLMKQSLSFVYEEHPG